MKKAFYLIGSIFVVIACISFVRMLSVDYTCVGWYNTLVKYFVLFIISVCFAYSMLTPHTILKYLFAVGFVWIYFIYRSACTITDLLADRQPQQYRRYRDIFRSTVINYEKLFIKKHRGCKHREVRR